MGVRYFGAEVRRCEDESLLTGQGRYVDDIELPGMLHGALVRSPHAHALVTSIDTSTAEAFDGVHAVFIYTDLEAPMYQRQVQLHPNPLISQDIRPYPLAKDEVCFVGEGVAFVLAESRHIAEDAAQLVDVTYDVLDPMVGLKDALSEDAPRTHKDAEDNLVTRLDLSYGDVDAAFAQADHVFKTEFLQHRGGCHAMECRGVVAQFDAVLDTLTIWSATQCPYLIRRSLAKQFELPESRLRIIAPDVGGGFGPKAGFYIEEILVPWAARKLGQPVKWIEDRREHFLTTNTQRDCWCELEIATTTNGRVEGVRGRMITENGAYLPYGVRLPLSAMAPFPGPYKVLALDLTQDIVYTNTVSNSPVRGAGRPNAAYAMERVMETVARELGLDPAEVRRRNYVEKQDFPYRTGLIHFNGTATTYDSGDFHGLLEKALKLSDYDGFAARQAAARKEGRYLGIGISSCIEDTGSGPYEGVTVRIDPQGQIYVASGASSQGQGHKTILQQIVADELGVVPEDIHVEIGDTAKFPQGVGTTGSRVAVNVGTAAYSAAGEVRSKALSLAADILGADLDDLELEDGLIRDKGRSNVTITFGELAQKLAPMAGGSLPAGHTASLDATSYDTSDGQPTASGTNVCEVEVDIGTGHVTLVNYSVAHDCGKKINPMIVEGQIVGGVVHGIGNALFEELIYDADGQPQNTNYGEYLLPLATEIPPIRMAHQETPSPLNPLGLKGAGEGGTIPAAGAVVAAIENALQEFGVVVEKYPVTPEYLCRLIDEGETH